MKKYIKKFIAILIIILTLLMLNSVVVNAAGFKDIDTDFVLDGAEDKSSAGDSIQKVIQALLTVFQVAATGIAVIMIIVLAMKYMAAAPGEKADIKKSAIAYVVGAMILFAASGILGIIRSFSEKNIVTS